jgi:GNAT superfamily N-acetyltransferase
VDTGDLLAPGPEAASVRPARASDAGAVAAVQARAWRRAYPGVIPAGALDRLDPQQLEPHWRRAVTDPPSQRHAVFVACSGAAVVGFAAVAPSTDPDADPVADAELVALEVDPAHQRAGHGSRLLAAAAQRLRETGFTALRVWCPEPDGARRAFLDSAGLRPDGARRVLGGGAAGELARSDADTTAGSDTTEVVSERLTAALPS